MFSGPYQAEVLTVCLVCLSEMLKYETDLNIRHTLFIFMNDFESGIPQTVLFYPLMFPK